MKARFLSALIAISSVIVPSWSLAGSPPVPDTMRAAAIDKGEDAESLSIHQLPVPKPAAGEVLIAVDAAGVGVWQAKYRPRESQDTHFPVVLGSDGAGAVAAVGAGVHGFKVGDPVYGSNAAFYAEYVSVPVEKIAHIPRGINPTETSVLAISGLSALQGLDDVLGLKAGEKLIIHGAVGVVGALVFFFVCFCGVFVLVFV